MTEEMQENGIFTEEMQENGIFVIAARACEKGRRAKLLFLFS